MLKTFDPALIQQICVGKYDIIFQGVVQEYNMIAWVQQGQRRRPPERHLIIL